MTCEKLICIALQSRLYIKLWGRVAPDVSAPSHADSEPTNPFSLLPKNSNTSHTSAMSSHHSLQAPASTVLDLTQTIQGNDSNYTQPDDQSRNTSRQSLESSPSIVSKLLAMGASSASGGTQNNAQESGGHSPDIFDLLKQHCPKHFEGKADMKAAWSALAYHMRINVVKFTWRCTKAHCGGKSLHYEARLPRLGETTPSVMSCRRIPSSSDMISVFFCLDGSTRVAATSMPMESQKETQESFDREAFKGLPDQECRDKWTVRDIINTGWFRLLPGWNTIVMTEDGNAGWKVIEPAVGSGMYIFYGLLDTARSPGYHKLPSAVQ
jgi:hypothetical protein